MINKKTIIILIIETICLALMLGIIWNISKNPAPQKEIHTQKTAEARSPVETVTNEVDEFVWTTDTADYFKTASDEQYIATFNKGVGLRRTGTTKNWSRVVTENNEYYIKTKLLTTKSPYEIDEGTKGMYQKYALSLFPKYGWESEELPALITLWNKESGWNPNAHNESSGAHGIPQSLPAEKMESEGDDYYTNGETQIRWGLGYIHDRYGTPSEALEFHLQHNWY